MSQEETEYSYEDMCTECDLHDRCHKNGIDYDMIDSCNVLYRESQEILKEKPQIQTFVLS